MSSATTSPAPACSPVARRAHRAARRARQHRPRPVPRRRRRVDHAAARQHDLGRGQAGVARARRPAARGSGAAAGRRRRRRSWSRSARTRGTRPRPRARSTRARSLAEQLAAARALVVVVAEAPEQADGDGLDVVGQVAEPLAQRVLVELAQHAVGPAALGHRHAQLGRHERRRVPGAQPVELGARLAAELLEVGEALGGEQRGARDLALEQRVRADGHPVHEALDVARRTRPACSSAASTASITPARLVVRRGRRLGGDQPAVRDQRGVGERPADVDSEQHGTPGQRTARRVRRSTCSVRLGCGLRAPSATYSGRRHVDASTSSKLLVEVLVRRAVLAARQRNALARRALARARVAGERRAVEADALALALVDVHRGDRHVALDQLVDARAATHREVARARR